MQIEWWNAPEVDDFLRSDLPPVRMLLWIHVAGDRPPQIITPDVVEYADFALASSPKCFLNESIQSLPTEARIAKTGMAYDATDFARLDGLKPKPHDDFRVGYIGYVDYVKMHRRYVHMSAAADIPNVKFVVCGGHKQEEIAKEGRGDRGCSQVRLSRFR